MDAAPPGRVLQRPGATLPLIAATAGFQNRALHAGDNHHAAAATLRVDLALGSDHLDAAAASAQSQVAADRAHVAAAAAGPGPVRAPNLAYTNVTTPSPHPHAAAT